jgi:autonomous glycyl radical cofactor GrcA
MAKGVKQRAPAVFLSGGSTAKANMITRCFHARVFHHEFDKLVNRRSVPTVQVVLHCVKNSTHGHLNHATSVAEKNKVEVKRVKTNDDVVRCLRESGIVDKTDSNGEPLINKQLNARQSGVGSSAPTEPTLEKPTRKQVESLVKSLVNLDNSGGPKVEVDRLVNLLRSEHQLDAGKGVVRSVVYRLKFERDEAARVAELVVVSVEPSATQPEATEASMAPEAKPAEADSPLTVTELKAKVTRLGNQIAALSREQEELARLVNRAATELEEVVALRKKLSDAEGKLAVLGEAFDQVRDIK